MQYIIYQKRERVVKDMLQATDVLPTQVYYVNFKSYRNGRCYLTEKWEVIWSLGKGYQFLNSPEGKCNSVDKIHILAEVPSCIQ